MSVLVHRIMSRAHRKNPFGFGQTAARWNPTGYPIIYTASHLSLCATELMAIMGRNVRLYDWCRIIYKVEGRITFFSKSKLPSDWNHRPHPTSTQQVGRQWLLVHRTPILAVPSARLPLSIYPAEFNLLINTMHPDMRSKVSVYHSEDFQFAMND